MTSFSAEDCADLIRQATACVALTGAGISTTAGIPDFRGPEGLYVTRKYDPEKVFDINAFHVDPLPFFEFARDFLMVAETIKPTFTHFFLADLEVRGRLHAVVTQNIDVLHQEAGSSSVIPVHGGFWTSHCLECGWGCDFDGLKSMLHNVKIPKCNCGGVIKPDVVFFGEAVDGMGEAVDAIARADLMLVLGSSLTVYPAAFLPQYAQCDVVVVNLGPVGLEPGPGRFFVDSDLDGFFRRVAESL